MARWRIDELLTRRARRSEFTRLLAHADSREAWTAALRALLPAEVARECHVANVRDHVLTVHLTTAAWATRFRFLAPEVLSELNRLADFAAVRDFRIKVAPVSAPGAKASDDHRERQPPDGRALARFADDLDYGELREAILRLARHAGPTDGAQSGTADGAREGPAEGA